MPLLKRHIGGKPAVAGAGGSSLRALIAKTSGGHDSRSTSSGAAHVVGGGVKSGSSGSDPSTSEGKENEHAPTASATSKDVAEQEPAPCAGDVNSSTSQGPAPVPRAGLGVRRRFPGLQRNPTASGSTPVGAAKPFSAPAQKVSAKPQGQGATTAEDSQPLIQYVKVLYCKNSKKKHKNWIDGLVILKNGRAKLMDEQGKQIASTTWVGKGCGRVKEGQELYLGAWLAEVGEDITEEDYLSGRFFLRTNASCGPVTSASPPKKAKPVKRKLTLGGSAVTTNAAGGEVSGSSAPKKRAVIVREAPTGALVLNPSHADDEFDVFVEPFLAEQLRAHQEEGIKFLYRAVMGKNGNGMQGAILADEMGLGKSLQTIALLHTLAKQGPSGKPVVRKAVVAAPASLVENWEAEFKKWLGTVRCSGTTKPIVFSGSGSADDQLQRFVHGPNPYLIISYDQLRKHAPKLQMLSLDMIVCDEGHNLKNLNAKKAQAIYKLPTKRRILLTGTPIQNNLTEFYSMVDFVNPGVLGDAAFFSKVFGDPISRGREKGATPAEKSVGEARAEEVFSLTKMFILRRTQEILHSALPPKVVSVVVCQMSSLQKVLYRHFLKSKTICSLYAGTLNSAQALMCMSALMKLVNHPDLVLPKGGTADPEKKESSSDEMWSSALQLIPKEYELQAGDEQYSGKMLFTYNLLQEVYGKCPAAATSGRSPRAKSPDVEKIVIASNYTKTLSCLEKMCSKLGLPFLRLDGSTPVDKRMSIVRSFNSPHSQYLVFLLSCKAGGVGLNLIGANRLVQYDADWNPAVDAQTMARIWRQGQKRPVYIYRLATAGTIEEKVLQRQWAKLALSDGVVDSATGNSSAADVSKQKFNVAELRDLFTWRDETKSLLFQADDVGSAPKSSVLASPSSPSKAVAVTNQWTSERDAIRDPALQRLALGSQASSTPVIFLKVMEDTHDSSDGAAEKTVVVEAASDQQMQESALIADIDDGVLQAIEEDAETFATEL